MQILCNLWLLGKHSFTILRKLAPTSVFTLSENGGLNHVIFLPLFLLLLSEISAQSPATHHAHQLARVERPGPGEAAHVERVVGLHPARAVLRHALVLPTRTLCNTQELNG